jgi:hypothetical protein
MMRRGSTHATQAPQNIDEIDMAALRATRTHCNNVTVTVSTEHDGSFNVSRRDDTGAPDSVSCRAGIPSWVEALDKADEWAHPDCDGKACSAWMPVPS